MPVKRLKKATEESDGRSSPEGSHRIAVIDVRLHESLRSRHTVPETLLAVSIVHGPLARIREHLVRFAHEGEDHRGTFVPLPRGFVPRGASSVSGKDKRDTRFSFRKRGKGKMRLIVGRDIDWWSEDGSEHLKARERERERERELYLRLFDLRVVTVSVERQYSVII